jgi:hypothetical protein
MLLRKLDRQWAIDPSSGEAPGRKEERSWN